MPYLAEGSGMWERCAVCSSGFVFLALTQEALSSGASFMLPEKMLTPTPTSLDALQHTRIHTLTQHTTCPFSSTFFRFFGGWVGRFLPSPVGSFIHSSNYNKQGRTTRKEAAIKLSHESSVRASVQSVNQKARYASSSSEFGWFKLFLSGDVCVK